ncbi:tetratricopeptide repeat protein [Ruminiclostridium herbifermentans]|uniref:Tetratricopeptide repeat protein n=1 Tax=Ruminiclostridium herbifermentans TaxID=2488810 RepID=A0A4U7JJU2_9FIRM|nr:tetratricopeptide repeat protein [Ruminiclostridium herbifermentans]QNU68298.1 tetratricopeptide repeat protein [Ruminiclostridium herbifermentans]
MEKKKITETITELTKVTLTIAGVISSYPAIELAAILLEYIYKILDDKGVLDSNIDQARKEQLNKAILSTVKETNKCLSVGNHRELVSSISDRLKLELSDLNNDMITLDAIKNKIEMVIEDEKIWGEKYFSKEDSLSIADTFYNSFLAEILKHSELRELVQITSIEKIICDLQQYRTQISKHEIELQQHDIKLQQHSKELVQIKDDIIEVKREINLFEPNFILTVNADTTPTEYFVGREDEIRNLKEFIRTKQKLILVSGMGGIGKTHLCRYIFREYVDCHKRHEPIDIDHIGYFDYTTSMDVTLYNNINFYKTGKMEKDIETAWKILRDISAEKRVLIFIDNVTNTPDTDESLKKLYEITSAIILTSRKTVIDRFKTYKIDEMELEQCIEMFEQIYGNVPQEDLEELEYILGKLAARHTKTVELLAHMANNKAWSIHDLCGKLEESHFNLSYISDGQKTTIQKEYEKLFNLAGLSESEVNVLEGFSVFPPLPLSADICNQWLNDDAALTEDDEIFNILYQKGWLQRSGKLYSMHPIIAETILTMQQPKTENHLKLINACINSLTFAETEVFTKVTAFLPFAEEIYARLYNNSNIIFGLFAGKIGYIYHHQGEYSKALEWYNKDLAIFEKVLGKEHPDTATTYNNIAGVYEAQGEYGKAIEWYQKALYICEKVLGKEHPSTATTYNNIAGVYRAQGEYGKALELYQKALDIRENMLGKEHPYAATTYNNIAGIYDVQGEYCKALEWYQKALYICEKVLGKEHPDTATTYNNIAGVYEAQGEYGKAIEWYQKALYICEKVLGKEHPDTATTYNNIAVVYRAQGEYGKALGWYKKALAIREKVLGMGHPDTATTYNNIAVVYQAQGEYGKALELYQKALDIREKVLGKEHPSTASTYNNIAGVYEAQGEYGKAIEWYQKALYICEKVLGKEHPDTATTYNNIAVVYRAQGEYGKALGWYKKALAIREKVLGMGHPDTATTYNNIAVVYQAQGEYGKALELYQKALDIREKVLGKEHPSTASTYNNIAGVYHAQGNYTNALELYFMAFYILMMRVGQQHPYIEATFNNMYTAYTESGGREDDFEEWFIKHVNDLNLEVS